MDLGFWELRLGDSGLRECLHKRPGGQVGLVLKTRCTQGLGFQDFRDKQASESDFPQLRRCPHIFLVPNFFSGDECQRLVRKALSDRESMRPAGGGSRKF